MKGKVLTLKKALYTDFEDCETPNAVSNLALYSEIVTVIYHVEKAIWTGFLLCMNSLLYTLICLPLKTVLFPQLRNLLRVCLLGLATLVLCYLYSVSRLYHDLKEQDFVKLSAVYNMLGVADQLLMSFGKRSIERLFGECRLRVRVLNFGVCLVYLVMHSFHLSLALTVFEVALNSSFSTLLLIVITSSFVELKITVFKKTDKQGLFRILCNDFIERLQLFMYLMTALVKSAIIGSQSLGHLVTGCLLIFGSSICIDWIKHYFILFFNNLPTSSYADFISINMKQSFLLSQSKQIHVEWNENTNNPIDPACSVTLAYRFTAMPHSCMLLRVFGFLIVSSLQFLDAALLFSAIYLVKSLLLSILILYIF